MNLPLPLELELATIHLVTLVARVTAESPDHVALETSYCTGTLVLFPVDFSLQVWPCKRLLEPIISLFPMFTGFPIVLVTVVVILGLSSLMVLGCTVIMLITITRCFRKVWMAHKYEELS